MPIGTPLTLYTKDRYELELASKIKMNCVTWKHIL